MRLTPVHCRDFIKRLKKLGWDGAFTGGKHQFMAKGDSNLPIPNPHGSGEISVGNPGGILNKIGIETKD